jgi:hypothetical protein
MPARHAGQVLIVSTVFVVAVLASALAPTPQELPSIAFGWTLLLHFERAAALLALLGGTSLILWRATEGRYPVRFAQIEYEPREVDEEIWDAIERLDKHIYWVQDLASAPLPRPQDRVEDH